MPLREPVPFQWLAVRSLSLLGIDVSCQENFMSYIYFTGDSCAIPRSNYMHP